MVFAYYKRLNQTQKGIYRASDKVTSVRLPEPGRFSPLVTRLGDALKEEHRGKTQTACQQLIDAMVAALNIDPVSIKVLAARPHKQWGELHGLYYPRDAGTSAHITVWMRTARQRRVVAFKAFFRTVLHEFGHHLDYSLLKLDDSFHTEGFYKRESSLFHQLTGQGKKRPIAPAAAPEEQEKDGSREYEMFKDRWALMKKKLQDNT
jgi:hypothetical protein